jgi:hypothetical protein
MVEIGTITATLNAAITTLKEIAKLAEKTKDKELNQRVLELQQSLMTANTQLLELSSENQTLRGRVSELEQAAKYDGQLEYEESVYWKVADGKRIDGPFCTVCWDSRRSPRPIHLTPGATKGTYGCDVCGASFETSEYVESTVLGAGGRPIFAGIRRKQF